MATDPKQRTLFNDPATYRAMSAPFPTPEACNAAITAFSEELRALRLKHRIRDVYVVIAGAVVYEGDDGEGEWMTTLAMGNAAMQPALAAYGLGEAQADHRERINKLTAMAGRKGRTE